MNLKGFNKWAGVYDLIYGEYKNDIKFYKKEVKNLREKFWRSPAGQADCIWKFLKMERIFTA